MLLIIHIRPSENIISFILTGSSIICFNERNMCLIHVVSCGVFYYNNLQKSHIAQTSNNIPNAYINFKYKIG